MKLSLNKFKAAIAILLISATLSACTPAATQTAAAPAEQASTPTEAQTEPTATTQAEAVPAEATTAPVEEVAPAEATAAPAEEAAAAPVAMTKLNLNTLTGDDLTATIPGFATRMIREFLEYRPYVSIQEFRQEIGKYVGDEQVAEYEKYVYVPINVNESDAASLMQIPGVDDAKAQELMAARPYASNDAFLEKLATLVSADEAAAATGYLEAQ